MDDASSTSHPGGRRWFPLSDPTSVAEALVADTLSRCAEQMSLRDSAAVVDRLRRGDHVVHLACEQELARNVAEYLSYLDSDIKTVYRYEYTCGGQSAGQHALELRPIIHLVVLTERRTAALISVLAALDRALSQSLAERCGGQEAPSVLNVHVIADADIRNRAGYAALLFAPHWEPVQVWKR